MIIKAEQFLKSKIKEYYEKNFITVDNVEKREFGYGIHNRKILDRNINFKNDFELNAFLREKVPFYLSYSCAHYELPDAKPTTAKNYLQGEFLFEYDADDIPTPCKKMHDSWTCPKCGESGKGHIMKCPKCNNKTELSEWICDKCLDATKKQTKRLYNILIYELGFKENEIKIIFSGHKGFHTKIVSEKIQNLKQSERIELMDYITEEGLNFKELGFVPDNKGSIVFNNDILGFDDNYKTKINLETEYQTKPEKYLKRIKTIFNVLIPELKTKEVEITNVTNNKDLSPAQKSELINIKKIELQKLDDEMHLFFGPKISELTYRKLINNKQEALELLEKGIFYRPRKDSLELWYNLLENLKESQKLYVDRQTTIDIYKIIRCPNTIHGGAMLLAKELTIDTLDNFKAFEDAAIYKEGTLKIHLKKVPALLLNNHIYGPYDNEIVELPYNIAIYFLAKGAADEAIL